jgi:hypothetical protein
MPPSRGALGRIARGAVCGALACLLAAGAPLPAGAEVEVTPVPLPDGAPNRVGQLAFWGGLVLTDDRAEFGGFSALEVSPDGSRLWALSDQGRVLAGRLRYDRQGRLAGLDDATLAPLLDVNGAPVAGSRRDAEGLARLPDGSFVVSFEWAHRLALHAGEPAATAGVQLVGPGNLHRLQSNRGLEAVTLLADGRLFVLGETELAGEVSAFPGWLSGPDGWLPLAYIAARGYRPTGAATLPGGDVVVIERRDPVLILTGGRIVLLPQAVIRGGQSIAGIELARLVPPALNANYEGIAAWRDEQGRTRLLVISDNNFLSVQRTLLLQLVWESDGSYLPR